MVIINNELESHLKRKNENMQYNYPITFTDNPIILTYSDKNQEDNSSTIKVDKYSGLKNQGMTCYLNSLLQTLFMTPEFRLNILNWKYDENLHGKKEDCIPYQIKKLFAKLQLKKKQVEDTKSLTKSFQWGSAEAFYQHDIQELCRVLFEAIEISLNEGDKNFINEIFEGKSASIVQCNDCNYKSLRSDKFLDISLPIRNEFEKIYNNSLEMALSNYIKVELLEKDNQYSCDICKKKVDAKKYIKFEKLPNTLLFQLNRFEYNYMTDMRVKITDKVTFPLILDMNLFCASKNLNENDKNEDRKEDSLPFLSEEFFIEKADRNIDLNEECFQTEMTSAFKNGDNVYELYSIVIHSGTANGGHYFAYIKSFEDNCWYNFNDSEVSKISEKEIESIFGTKNSSGMSSTGYVLLYRKINDNGNKITNIKDEIIDEDLLKEINIDLEKDLEEEKAWKERMNMVTVKFFHENFIKEIKCKKNESIMSIKEKILKEFMLEEKYKKEDFMLRYYIKNIDKKAEYIEHEELSLEENSITSYKIYILQFREENGQFPKYDQNLFEGNLTFWSEDFSNMKEDKFPIIKFDFEKNDSQRQFKNRILKIIKLENENPEDFYYFRRLDISPTNFSLIEIFQNPNDKEKPILMNAIVNGCKIYVEKKDYENNSSIPISKPKPSKFLELINSFTSEILVCFNKPEIVSKSPYTTISHKWEFSINVNIRDKISVMKKKMAEILKINENEFIIKKYGPSANEIRDMNAVIGSITSSDINIFTQLGTPLQEDEIILNLSFLQYDYSEFKIFPYKFIFLDKFIVKKSNKVKEIKKEIINLIQKKIGKNIEREEDLIIRECIQDKPAKIYMEETVLGDIDYIENKTLLVQEYKKELLSFGYNDIQLSIRFIDFNEWRVDEPIEMHIDSNTTFLQFGEMINIFYPDLKAENLSIYRVISPINISYESLSNSNSFESIFENMDSKLSQYPYYIKNDGCLIFVKDISIDRKYQREATEQEIKFYLKIKSDKIIELNDNYKPVICTALVLKPDSNNTEENILKPSTNFSEAKSLLESKFGGKFTNKSKGKEKCLVIKVKKQMIEEETEKDKINLYNDDKIAYNADSIIKPNEIKNKKIETELDEKDMKCNYSEDLRISKNIQNEKFIDDINNFDYELNSNENGFMEPLI